MIRRQFVEENEVIGLKGLFPIGMSVKGKLKKPFANFMSFAELKKMGILKAKSDIIPYIGIGPLSLTSENYNRVFFIDMKDGNPWIISLINYGSPDAYLDDEILSKGFKPFAYIRPEMGKYATIEGYSSYGTGGGWRAELGGKATWILSGNAEIYEIILKSTPTFLNWQENPWEVKG